MGVYAYYLMHGWVRLLGPYGFTFLPVAYEVQFLHILANTYYYLTLSSHPFGVKWYLTVVFLYI